MNNHEFSRLERWFTPGLARDAKAAAVALTAEKLSAFFLRRDHAIQARDAATAQAGRNWEQLDRSLVVTHSASEIALADLRPSGLDLERWNHKQLGRLREALSGSVDTLKTADALANSLTRRLGCPDPEKVEDVSVLVQLIEWSAVPNRALTEWFDPDVLPQVREAVRAISAAVECLSRAESHAEDVFLPEIVDVPELSDVIARLGDGPRGFSAFFSRQVRSDRRVIATQAVGGTWRSELYDALPLALEWCTAYQDLRALCGSYEELLGRFVNAETVAVETEALRSALVHAEAIHDLVPNVLKNPRTRAVLRGQLADGHALDPILVDEGTRLKALLESWKHTLGLPEISERSPELSDVSLGRAAYWAQAHLEPLESACEFVDKILCTIGPFRADTSDHTLGTARLAVASAHKAQDEVATFLSFGPQDRKLLGPWYEGLGTTLESLEKSMADQSGYSETARRLIRLAIEELDSEPDRHATVEQVELLGRYAPEGNPDIEALAEALEAVDSIVRSASDSLHEPMLRTKLIAAIADGYVPAEDLKERVLGILQRLTDWHQAVSHPSLGLSGPALLTVTAGEAANWLRAHLEPLSEIEELVRTVAKVVDEGPLLTVATARSAVSAAATARRLEKAFMDTGETYRGLLGALYAGLDTDPARIREAVKWAQSVRRAGRSGFSAPLDEPVAAMMLTIEPDDSLQTYFEDWRRQRKSLLDCFKPKRRSELGDELLTSLADAEAALDLLADDPYGPETWLACSDALGTLDKYRLRDLPSQLAQRGASAHDFPAAVERAVLVAWVEHHFAKDERLKPHRGVDRDNLVARFQDLDRELVEAAHADVIAACNAKRPKKTTVGQAAVLRREAMKQRRHMPVRRLLDETREVVRLIKPCFMMSPLTVSQFLSSDYRFDVVIFDEASQVLPQDAVNSIYRGDALVVAGDPRQLPPTSFFNAASDSNDEDEWEEDESGFESILDSCKASGILRSLPLRWHYRSRHEHLIAYSNHEFYENSMVTFPGSREDGHDIGVEFFKVDGVYDRGGRRDNQIEAAYVAERVIHHFETRPALTLGVVALSKVQAEAIEESVDRALKNRPDLARFFTENRLDGFFVKNLETVQGDERDVIILSIGYGRDAQGRLRSEFGPINRNAGWRRLNVAVTRARRRMEVVASFRGSELSDSTNKSVQHLKRYLEYAEYGPNILATQTADPDAEPESPFEQSVLDVLKEWGYSVQPQVGVAGYRIDMAVRHPDAPGAYALGIECDGAMYHSSRAARDRDRLREAVLRDLGWKLHRIWGTDWYRNRSDAMARLRAAVETACAVDPFAVDAQPEVIDAVIDAVEESEDRETAPELPQIPAAARTVEFVSVEDYAPDWAQEYKHLSEGELYEIRQEAARELGRHWIELQDTDSTDVIAILVLEVLECEGPIEEELIFTRVRSAWLLSKSGQVIQKRIRTVLKSLLRKKRIVALGTAYDLPDRDVVVARTPTSQCNRKVAHVPAVERQFAMRRLVEDSPGISSADLLREVARFFGWARLGAEIKAALTSDMKELLERQSIVETEGRMLPRPLLRPSR
ncbi:DUF3320 domain-containing protein [Rhodococcus chondri]|uniref:DUF3320 domain-containing protein n=1 Tax=Rhodococcus chondri TaxID=3065941 RepID=A0ABU7JQN7_9NOCA|nr:DUF3320 domain-containing protein [Rhodococcus sp. CC-R104]MEE2032325.1 DUF3320 domain-containing protein [Rhodococcus sp. CC-R104]